MAKIIGIDLGTTNSEVAILEGGKPTVISSAEGNRYFPSVVAFTKDGERLVGEAAKRQAVTNPERTFREIKRKMGTNFTVKVDSTAYTPQQISAMVLTKIKEDVENYLGEEVTQAVITVPAYFDDNQRTATKDAGKIAGLEVLRIINEPTAAALAYGLDKKGDRTLAVIDLGGGTFDVTVMEISEGVYEVVSTSGDTHLGGADMDQRLIDWLIRQFKKDHEDLDPRKDPQAMQRLRDAAETAKMELTSTTTATINLPFLMTDSSGPKHLEVKITRAKLEELVEPVVKRMDGPMRQAVQDAKIKKEAIDHIILVGGPTRMPIVRDAVKAFFEKEPERGVDPMECVAMGAAIQGGVLAGEVKDILLLDVTPLSLGLETLGGVFTSLIDRNTTIPTKRGQIFSTAADNQGTVEIYVLQGERPMSGDNMSLGKFQLVGIPPAPRGVPQVEVTFNIDANGILNVSAKDLGTGKEQAITITASTKLSDQEIDRMVADAESHKATDEERRKHAEERNEAEGLAHGAKRMVKEFKDKVSADDRKKVEEAVADLETALEGDDLGAINAAKDLLTEALHTASTALYQAAAADAASKKGGTTVEGTPEESDDGDGKVVDVDYEEVEQE